jgi:cell division control protein 42
VVNTTSYDNVKSKWVREVHRHCPGVPIILVGTQTDRRTDTTEIKRLKSQGRRPFTKADGNKLASQCKATCYLECSARTQQNVKHTFDEAIAAGLELGSGGSKHTPQCAGCTIL